MTDRNVLRRAAERASRRRLFLASSLLPYAAAEGLDDDALAAQLGCDPADLSALLLCRRPTGEGPTFRRDVEAVAERFHLNPARLARLIRAADALVALGRAAPDATGGLLAAARDRGIEVRRPGESADGPSGDQPADRSGDAPGPEGYGR